MATTDCDTATLRGCIEVDFPPSIYRRNIFSGQYDSSGFEFEEDDLNIVLRDMTWRDIPREFIKARYDEYLLMGDAALPIFLGAWLWVAVEDLNGWNEVRYWLVYGIARQALWSRYLRALNEQQRSLIRRLLICAKSSEPDLIGKALKSIDLYPCGEKL